MSAPVPDVYRGAFSYCRYENRDFESYHGSEQGAFSDRADCSYGKIDYDPDAADIPVPDSTFDAALCTEVLEHVPDPIAVVRELARILKPGGRLLLSAPLGLHQEPYHLYGGYTPYCISATLETPVSPSYRRRQRRLFSPLRSGEPALLGDARPATMRDGRPWVPLFWLMTLPWFRLVMPIVGRFLDRVDRHRGFTVGYHVTAVRARH
jgi:SAM-dependent methyltransferase